MIQLPSGSTADIIEGVSCPYKEVGALIEGKNGQPTSIVAAQPCRRSCGVFDKAHGQCSHVTQAHVFAEILGLLKKMTGGAGGPAR